MRINLALLTLSLFLLSSCGSLLHKMHKVQSDKRFRKTEDRNFVGNKALTQWWYFDCFFDDGSVLVMMFVPHHWWADPTATSKAKTLIYTSYLTADGNLISEKKIMDAEAIHFDEHGLSCSYVEILRTCDKNTRTYTLNFFMDQIKGSAKISSDIKAFSPLPRGSMGTFGTKHILKTKGKKNAYRYAAHVPQGEITASLQVEDQLFELSGKAYHEQGWFTGEADQMGDGWVWFHFVSENINLFGARSFFYLKMNDELLIGGLNSGDNRCVFSKPLLEDCFPNLIVGGKLNYHSAKLAFEVNSLDKTSTPLVYIPSDHTQQIWGTVLQPSSIHIRNHEENTVEDGRLLIETSFLLK